MIMMNRMTVLIHPTCKGCFTHLTSARIKVVNFQFSSRGNVNVGGHIIVLLVLLTSDDVHDSANIFHPALFASLLDNWKAD